MALTNSSDAKEITSAIYRGSSVLLACSVYFQVPNNWTFERKDPLLAVGPSVFFRYNDVTPPKVDPNGDPAQQVPVDETFKGTHITRSFSGPSTTVLATAIAGVEALVLALIPQGKLPGPATRIFFGKIAKVTGASIAQTITFDISILLTSDATRRGRFVVAAQAIP